MFVHEFPVFNLCIFKQTRDRLESRILVENDIRGIEDPRKVLGGPLSSRLFRLLICLLEEIHLPSPPRTRPADLDD